MNNYRIFILKRAQKELAKVIGKDFDRIKKTIFALANNPRPPGCKKLTARDGWRIRVGKYRIIYEIDDKEKIIIILHIGLRRDIYQR